MKNPVNAAPSDIVLQSDGPLRFSDPSCREEVNRLLATFKRLRPARTAAPETTPISALSSTT